VNVNLPLRKERQEILDFFLEKQTVAPDVDTATLARETTGLSGADLENIVNIAALASINEVCLFVFFTAPVPVAMGVFFFFFSVSISVFCFGFSGFVFRFHFYFRFRFFFLSFFGFCFFFCLSFFIFYFCGFGFRFWLWFWGDFFELIR
jgi:hypothetical protein